MEKNLYIDASHPDETRVVLKSKNYIEEYEYENKNKLHLKNNIYSIPSKFGLRTTKILASISHSITLILIFLIGIISNLNPIYWIGCTIILLLFLREHMILKNITQTNINKAFFDMNGQISIILMLTFTISTILQ